MGRRSPASPTAVMSVQLPHTVVRGTQRETRRLRLLVYMFRNLQLISDLMGRGFTAPPTSPDLKESGGCLKRERLHLMEKLQVFIPLAASPWTLCPTKPGFVFVLCRDLCRRGVGSGDTLQL